jgi:serine/threonine protein phosphatase PrpC
MIQGSNLIAAVADGAGSAKHADKGAAIVVQSFFELGPDLFASDEAAEPLLKLIKDRIEQSASETQARPEEFSSTLVGAIVGPESAVFVQVGDGAAVVSSESAHKLAIEPESFEFVNSTRFATSADASLHLRLQRIDGPVEAIALFSDGLQPLLLDSQNQPHAPFFDAAFRNLVGRETHDLRASEWIAKTLTSDPVTRRTDDDTSLVIARKVAE